MGSVTIYMRRWIGRKYQELQFSTYTLSSKYGSQLFQAAGSSRTYARNGHLHRLGNNVIAWVPRVEIQQFDELSTTVRKQIYGFPNALLLL
jgi:hypothetical protein